MTHPAILAKSLVEVIERARIDVTTEDAAHRGLLTLLRSAYPDIETEVRLSDKDRIDLLVGGVGIEIKTATADRRKVFAQLQRYLAHERVGALILATAAPWPKATQLIGGKRLMVASLSRGWL